MPHYDRLSTLDRSFLDLEDKNTPMHIAGAFLFDAGPLRNDDGYLDMQRIRDYVDSRLHLIPRYRQRIERTPIEGDPVWVDDERFNIFYHVRHTSLPAPGSERQLKRLCGRILSQQLDRSKPLWELWLVEGLEHDRVAMISKTHHCMVDGVSGNELLQALLQATPEKTFEPAPRWIPRNVPSTAEFLRDSFVRRISAPLRLANSVLEAAAHPDELRHQASELFEGLRDSFESFGPTLDTPLNQEIGPHRRFDWLAFDLDEVKRVKNALGGTLNDVVLAIVSGAVREFLQQRGMPESKLQRGDFRAFCPVSVRREDEQGTLGNRVSAMLPVLPIGETDPARRLHEVSRRMGDLKKSKQALGAEALASVSEWTPATLVAAAARIAFRNRASNLVVTNVPGPQVPLYLLGARMAESYPMVPLFVNQGLGIALFSYAGGLYWGFNADWDGMPDLHDFVLAIDRSFRELCDAADGAL